MVLFIVSVEFDTLRHDWKLSGALQNCKNETLERHGRHHTIDSLKQVVPMSIQEPQRIAGVCNGQTTHQRSHATPICNGDVLNVSARSS